MAAAHIEPNMIIKTFFRLCGAVEIVGIRNSQTQ
jgi:hypothetical protein